MTFFKNILIYSTCENILNPFYIILFNDGKIKMSVKTKEQIQEEIALLNSRNKNLLTNIDKELEDRVKKVKIYERGRILKEQISKSKKLNEDIKIFFDNFNEDTLPSLNEEELKDLENKINDLIKQSEDLTKEGVEENGK